MFSDNILPVTTATFEQEVIKSDLPVVVDFWGTNCVPCKQIANQFELLAVKAGKRVKFVSVNVEENKELARELGLRSVPAFRIYRNGVKHYEATGIQNFAGLQLGVGQLVGTLLREEQHLEALGDEPAIATSAKRIDQTIDGKGVDNTSIDGIPAGTKVLLINQLDPRLNGVRVIGEVTDMDRTKALFNDLEIGYFVDYSCQRKFDQEGILHSLRLDADTSAKVEGYSGFTSRFNFDQDGKFVSVGVWE